MSRQFSSGIIDVTMKLTEGLRTSTRMTALTGDLHDVHRSKSQLLPAPTDSDLGHQPLLHSSGTSALQSGGLPLHKAAGISKQAFSFTVLSSS